MKKTRRMRLSRPDRLLRSRERRLLSWGAGPLRVVRRGAAPAVSDPCGSTPLTMFGRAPAMTGGKVRRESTLTEEGADGKRDIDTDRPGGSNGRLTWT